jgi:hypothetical protein
MTRYYLFILLLFSAGLSAQKTEFSEYDWNTFNALPVPDSIKPLNGSLITLERHINEVYLNKDEVFEEISIYHRKIRVESHDAINRFNKIYVPISDVIEVLDIRARFISPAGRITEVPKESIRQIENLENKGNYKTFAIEGVEPGGEIEYYYKLRKKFNPYGSVTMQGIDPRVNVEVIYAFPQKLEFLFKSYNGFPDFAASYDSLSGLSYLKAGIKNIPSLPQEDYSAYEANLMRFEFTLTHNTFNSSLRLYSFSKVSGNIYNNVYILSKDEKASVMEVIKKLQITGKSVEQQIRTVEHWLKSEIAISEDLSATPSVDEMIKLRQTTKFGITRLFVAFLNQLDVNFELVISCDQAIRPFDPDFNGWNYLNDYLIYFPEVNKVIIPDNSAYRLGLMPSNYQNSYGLFFHPLTFEGETSTLAYDVKRLPEENYRNNADTFLIRLKVNLEEMNLDVDVKRVFTGELASSFQSFWRIANQEKHDEIVSSLFNMGSQNTTIDSFSITNDSPADIAIRPLIWNVSLTANSLIEQAGDDIIVKIGETIGEQSEMYQQSNRVLPVYVGSLHNYYRKIVFEIPKGYTVSNVQDLTMNVKMISNNRVSCCFKADYEIVGSTLVIYSTEYYSELFYPVEDFQDFRDVINAAADFNKKTILLTKN